MVLQLFVASLFVGVVADVVGIVVVVVPVHVLVVVVVLALRTFSPISIPARPQMAKSVVVAGIEFAVFASDDRYHLYYPLDLTYFHSFFPLFLYEHICKPFCNSCYHTYMSELYIYSLLLSNLLLSLKHASILQV